jgi:hypothetical protein
MKKENTLIFLPRMMLESDEPIIKQVAEKVNELINSMTALFGDNGIRINTSEPTPNGCEIKIYGGNKQYAAIEEYKYDFLSYSKKDTLWHEAFLMPYIARVYYTRDFFQIFPTEEFREMMKLLIGEPVTKDGINFYPFMRRIDKMIPAINALFLKQDIQPTSEKRYNLMGLATNLPNRLLKDKRVQKLLGTSENNHNVLNANLVRAADLGYNDKMVKLFYVHDYFPSNPKEAQELNNLPYSMFETVVRKAK